MTNPLILSEAQQTIGRRWNDGQSLDQARILGLARDALDFISATGQWYPFDDYRVSGWHHGSPPAADERSTQLHEQLRKTEAFFERLLDDPTAADEQPAIQVILDALRFISSTRQHEAFAHFLEHLEANAPPYVMAAFDTWDEAEAWLQKHPSPPLFAEVLIGNKPHDVVYDRETNFRRLPWNRRLHRYLAWLEEFDPPEAEASFSTLEEAEAWLMRQAHPAKRTWVKVAGEFYLAVYYSNINHRALFPMSMAVRGSKELKSS
ncbi:hypothetical protein [Cystobacter fuscus]|uniref:hypothetical protein n=1 Tax=Cystobacter fuscus TaxID=43 RepID=UPI002B2BC903|nr:hypothetical protein F0U63_22405 [Cystobacter fuscus]